MLVAKLTRIIGWGLTVLVALMPLHALIVISLGHWLGHEAIWAGWKEALLVILTALTAIVIWRRRELRARLEQPWVYLVAIFASLALITTAILVPPFHTAIFGLKTDLEFLLAGVIALIVADRALARRLIIVLLGSTTLVVIFGLLQATILPHDSLTQLGYGFAPGQTEPYATVYVGTQKVYRFGSTLGGFNQLGTFLILPLALSLIWGWRRHLWWLLSLAILPVLFFTYSRGAWAGAIVAVATAKLAVIKGRLRWVLGAGLAVVAIAISLLALVGPAGNPVARYWHHSTPDAVRTSDSDHAASLKDGAREVAAAPLGHGLGTAGPATFHGGSTNIIEDNYLQIGYELGWLGVVVYIGIIGLGIWLLIRPGAHPPEVAIAAAIAGISITALVLPAWTDSSTALTVWTIAGAGIGARRV